jgi:AcrR family transcriptional regulator
MPRSPISAAIDMQAEVSTYRRQLIVREASLLFFERGYQATTMDDIANRLNVTKPLLYAQFESKGDLLFHVCQGGMSELLGAVDRLLRLDIEPGEKLRQIVSSIATTIIEKQAHVAVFFREARHLSRQQAKSIHKQQEDFDRKLAALLDEGVAAGMFEVDDAGLTGLAITGMMAWMFSWYRYEGRLTDEQLRDGFVALAVRMVTPTR